MRSRVTLAMIEAAAMETETGVAIDKGVATAGRAGGQSLPSTRAKTGAWLSARIAAPSPDASPAGVDEVDSSTLASPRRDGRCHDAHERFLARVRRHLLESFNALRDSLAIQDHRGRHNGPARARGCLVNAGDRTTTRSSPHALSKCNAAWPEPASLGTQS